MHGVLLSFVGFRDPYGTSPISGAQEEGPLLTLLEHRSFDTVILFSTPNTVERSDQTRQILLERHPGLEVEIPHARVVDPTDYRSILNEIRRQFEPIRDRLSEAAYFISTASGTPQMHAAWLLLAASGEIPATLLKVRAAEFVGPGRDPVSDVDLGDAAFPQVTPLRAEQRLEAAAEPDLAAVCAEIGIVGSNPRFLKALKRAAAAAPYTETVLIGGENGSGKELVARLVHQLSTRSAREMVTVNCAALPSELAESILFGHRKGSFTGAVDDQPGKFKLADGSTLFLDEVGELPEAVQAKLLRAVEQGEIESVGAGRPSSVDVRIIAATNRSLTGGGGQKPFRDDFYFRLKNVQVELPPLRERREDIALLAVFFLNQFNRQYGQKRRLTPKALERLHRHWWPGNVRELENTIREAAIITAGTDIDADDLELRPIERAEGGLPEPHHGFSMEDYLKDVRRRLIDRALEIARGNGSEAGRLLDVSPAAISKELKKREEGE